MLQILLIAVVLLVLVWIFWRLSSQRTSMPCPARLAWLVEMENPFAKNYNASSIIRTLDVKPGMCVLDVGCGPGRVTIPLAKAVGPDGNVVAIDIRPEMLRRARAKAQNAGVSNIDFQELAIHTGKLGADRFDAALLVTVLGEIPDRESALLEIHRVLKQDGILSITEIIFDPHYQSRSSIRKLAERTGFREKAFFGNKFAFTVHLEKQRKLED